MATIKLLGPLKKQYISYPKSNIIELTTEEIGMTIKEVLYKRNIVIDKPYSYCIKGKIVRDNYIIKLDDDVVLMPILFGG